MHSLTKAVLVVGGAAVMSAAVSAPAMASPPAGAPAGTELVVEHAVAHIPVDLSTVDALLGADAVKPAHVQVLLGEPTVAQPQVRDQPKHPVRKCAEGLAWDRKHLTCTYVGLIPGQPQS